MAGTPTIPKPTDWRPMFEVRRTSLQVKAGTQFVVSLYVETELYLSVSDEEVDLAAMETSVRLGSPAIQWTVCVSLGEGGRPSSASIGAAARAQDIDAVVEAVPYLYREVAVRAERAALRAAYRHLVRCGGSSHDQDADL